MKKRMRIVMLAFLIVCVPAIIYRLVVVQMVDHEFYQDKAIDQQTRDSVVSPKRGKIYDRNMKTLAASASVETVYISPNAIKDDKEAQLISDNLSQILGVDRDTIYKKTQAKNYYEVIKKKVEQDESDKVRTFIKDNKLTASVALIEDSKRYYPYGNFASHVIGFTNVDGVGIEGVEAYYEDYLKGVPGRIITAKNAKGTEMPYKYETYIDPQNGKNLVLTIDEVLQHFLEKHLEQAVVDYNIQNRAAGIIMNVKTGEILAMAVKPDFDLNNPREITDENVKAELAKLSGDEKNAKQQEEWQKMWRNKIISDTYEPGSVFKLFTSSMAIEENLVHENDQFFCPGYKIVSGVRIGCWKAGGHGSENFLKGLQNSCNPVFMEVGERVGPERFYKYVTAFGFREKTGIDLYGEANGIFHSMNNLKNPVSLAVSAFGQTFKVTPIQMITGICAVANGGYLVTPHVAKEVVDDNGNVINSFDTNVRRQVISSETSKMISSYMETVVSQGTGKNAYVAGYRIGGKTATSEKIDEKNAQGVADKRIASFACIAPSDDPQIAMLIMFDEPNVPNPSGGVIAAPVVRKIMSDVLPYLQVTPKYTEAELQKMEIDVKDLTGKTITEAQKIAREEGHKLKIEGGGSSIVSQVPRPGAKLASGGQIIVYTDSGSTSHMIEVPNVKGMSPDKAAASLQQYGLNIKMVGADNDSSATAVSQQPACKSKVEAGSVVTIEFNSNDIINDTGKVMNGEG
ncbi:MAG: penicillin-binding transpeptidase domain-containing protein [Bacillota bacterium]|nr:penicillin-binding transpeptidase domain-containing protein [Bacillota bacterium]